MNVNEYVKVKFINNNIYDLMSIYERFAKEVAKEMIETIHSFGLDMTVFSNDSSEGKYIENRLNEKEKEIEDEVTVALVELRTIKAIPIQNIDSLVKRSKESNGKTKHNNYPFTYFVNDGILKVDIVKSKNNIFHNFLDDLGFKNYMINLTSDMTRERRDILLESEGVKRFSTLTKDSSVELWQEYLSTILLLPFERIKNTKERVFNDFRENETKEKNPEDRIFHLTNKEILKHFNSRVECNNEETFIRLLEQTKKEMILSLREMIEFYILVTKLFYLSDSEETETEEFETYENQLASYFDDELIQYK